MLALFNIIDIDIFAFAICSLLLYDNYNRNEKHLLEYRLFNALLISIMALLALDAGMWAIDGRTWLNPILFMAVDSIYYIMNPVPAFLWVLYADYQIFNDEKHTRHIFWPFLFPAIINALLVFITPITGSMFFLDQNYIYHRGPWFPVMVVVVYLYIIYAFILIFRHRDRIGKRHYPSLLSFSIPPIICIIIQVIYYGLNLIWSSATLSLLIVYLHIQKRKLRTDYLTGVYNRMQFDRHLREKIDNSTVLNTFGGILIDIDNFKTINDDFGHDVGDEALEEMAELFKRSLRKDDFLARYGGDEFFAILDVQSITDIKKSVERIYENINSYNRHNGKPYKINVSIGYDIYDSNAAMNEEQFIKHIDTLMYACKNEHKENQ